MERSARRERSLGAGGAWQMARVGVKDEPITYDDVKGVLDASQTVVLNSLDARVRGSRL